MCEVCGEGINLNYVKFIRRFWHDKTVRFCWPCFESVDDYLKGEIKITQEQLNKAVGHARKGTN